MTIASDTNKSGPYFYNGAATTFAYGFKISSAAHIRVVETVIATGVETDLVLNTDYTVTGVGADAGGNVVITPPRATGKSATLVRKNPFTQGVVLENQGAYFAKVVEGAFDDAVARDQQLQEQISRAVLVPVSADASDLEELVTGIVGLLDNVDAVVTVAGISAAVSTVAANATTTATVAANIAAVATAASNIATIIAVPGLATQVVADRVQTGQDRTAVATNKGLVDTAKTAVDAAKVAADADAASTHADALATAADRVATAADRVQTGIDRAAAEAAAGSLDPAQIRWLGKAVGEMYAVDDSMVGAEVPPTNSSSFRYVKLTAADAYNTGVIVSESVSGSAPAVQATGVVSLTGSPVNGQTLHLINTERRGLRAGAAGTVEADMTASHVHTGTATSGGAHTHTGSTDSQGAHTHTYPIGNTSAVGTVPAQSTGSASTGTTNSAGAHTHNVTIVSGGAHTHAVTVDATGGTETRHKNLGVTYYMRIK